MRQTFDVEGKSALLFDKDRSTMSEAIAYFEYVRDLVSLGEARMPSEAFERGLQVRR
ncbi:MAG: hypothetical protein JO247_08045, partial [Chloroflexi bacterium]|nr:hypothetical protein [Chloroflexota bacterium]